MSNLEELEVKNVCSLSCDAPTNMCSLLGDHTCRVRGCTTSGRYVRILDFRHFESFLGLIKMAQIGEKRHFPMELTFL